MTKNNGKYKFTSLILLGTSLTLPVLALGDDSDRLIKGFDHDVRRFGGISTSAVHIAAPKKVSTEASTSELSAPAAGAPTAQTNQSSTPVIQTVAAAITQVAVAAPHMAAPAVHVEAMAPHVAAPAVHVAGMAPHPAPAKAVGNPAPIVHNTAVRTAVPLAHVSKGSATHL